MLRTVFGRIEELLESYVRTARSGSSAQIVEAKSRFKQ
jgi:hypothetical protein